MGGEDAAIQFHIMVLQLLVMLISENTIMQRDVSMFYTMYF